jgi:hypothetical protein
LKHALSLPLAATLILLTGLAATHLHAQTPLQIAQQAYLKASNTEAGDSFGNVAISGDIMVVGAPWEDSDATGVNGAQGNNGAPESGAAYVFVREGTNWTQQVYLKASNAEAGDGFGYWVAVSGDTIVVGALNEDSNAKGVNDNQGNNSATDSGAAYVFVRSGTGWIQQAYLKASNTDAGDAFGIRLAISGDTIVVGAIGESSSATGVNGNQANNSAFGAGAAYVFVRQGTNWSQQAYLKASNTKANANFCTIAVSGDTVVVGSEGEAFGEGAAYVFVRSGTNWTQQALLKASNPETTDLFGGSVGVSGDTIVVGASGEGSNATGVNGNPNNNSAFNSGAAYVFVRRGTTWSRPAYLKASNTGGISPTGPCPGDYCGDFFGSAVGISGDTVIVGAPGESSGATGVNGNQADNSATNSGAAYVFVRNGTNWTQQAYLKASNTRPGDYFGGVAISGGTVVVGAGGEDSGATGVNGDPTDTSAPDSGAAYVFTGLGPTPPELRLTAARNGNLLQLTATGTPSSRWRLESRDTVTGTNAWQPLTNITLGPNPTVIQQPLDGTNRFYRGAWVP